MRFSNDQVKWAIDMRGKMKQRDIAKAIGCTQSHVSRLQLGKVRNHTR